MIPTKKKVGLFFGSFNPIHIGHLIIANSMVELAELDQVWLVVSPQNPFKKKSTLAHEFDRYDLVDMAIKDNFKLQVTDVEFRMPKPSYTIDTLIYLSEKHPSYEFQVIVGQDNLSHFHKWKNHEVILEDYGLVVYPRPEAKKSRFDDHPKVRMVHAPMVDISATFIRQCLKEERSIKYIVPDEVINMIKLRKLFGA
ncbi:nicotinate (nicotinamide) nucleotide adenylyltransferase [Persicobacter psychrovividus]|uniref:Probable nicotinate-nucleotide adenylyltransferase n=1 Tax=Persicobacter psychrovividus TaxID=387638 RepID=A0ABM7VAV9_9BACT|nr:putative nicotinate-nucleotide adenylyltransferase [Persicobacter psychrovividus]